MSEIGDYKGNSYREKEEAKQEVTEQPKKVEKVVSGQVKKKKKSEFRKLGDVFISEDAANVKSFILMDVLVPAIKKAISDIVVNGIDMVLYGGTGRLKRDNGTSKVSYRSYYDRKDDRDSRPSSGATRNGYDYDDITFPTRGEAELVREHMENIVDQYGIVTVADFYELAGVQTQYTDQKYGWTNLRSVKVTRVYDGYRLDLPKAFPIH